jgi:hypothetical protein
MMRPPTDRLSSTYLLAALGAPRLGAALGARLKSKALYRVIASLLVVTAEVLLFAHEGVARELTFTGLVQLTAGIVAGFVIGIVASLLGVAGGELLIPTFVLLYGMDAKLAGVCRSRRAFPRCSWVCTVQPRPKLFRASAPLDACW